MRVLVMTIVHHPEDARILHRQIRALTDAGHDVVYAAPFEATGTQPRPNLTGVDLPRALGRRRLPAVRAARQAFRTLRRDADIVLLHDPELLVATAGTSGTDGPPLVWDVHEDTAAALRTKPWLPRAAAPLVATLTRLAEAAAERRVHLVLAEHGYATRFARTHPVVPNEPVVPTHVEPPGDDRVVYLGWLSAARGAHELVAAARDLHRAGIRVDLVGPADHETARLLRHAVADGILTWSGFVPNDVALPRLSGALAGLSLLHDQPNYRHSMPTKVLEYMAAGIPVVTTPTPLALELVSRHSCGEVVPYGNARAVVRAVKRLREDAADRSARGARGHQAARAFHDWQISAGRFVAQMEKWSADRVDGETFPHHDTHDTTGRADRR